MPTGIPNWYLKVLADVSQGQADVGECRPLGLIPGKNMANPAPVHWSSGVTKGPADPAVGRHLREAPNSCLNVGQF